MTNPIQTGQNTPSPRSAGNTAGASGQPTGLSNLLNRLGAGQGAANGSAEAGSFARWMAQARQPAATGLQAEPSRAPAAPTPAKPSAAQAGAQATARNAARPSVARGAPGEPSDPEANARPEAPAQRPASASAEGARSQASRQGEARSAEARAAQARDQARQKDSADDTQAPEPAAKDEAVRFQTPQGEGTAMVRELTPPPTVQASDPASMMAWLVSLTQAEASPEGTALSEATLGDPEAGAGLPGAAKGLSALGTRAEERGQGLDGAALGWLPARDDATRLGGAAAGATGAAAFQVDALLGPASAEAALSRDALQGLSPGVQGLGFGRALGEAQAAPAAETATLSAPVHSPAFAEELAEQVAMWVGRARSEGPMTAELHLNPAEMGPIHIKIAVEGQAAQVDFAVAATETRQAIEGSLGALSSALSEAGLSLSGGGVSQQWAGAQQGGQPGQPGWPGQTRGPGGRGDDGGGSEPGELRAVPAPRPGRPGGLDLYA